MTKAYPNRRTKREEILQRFLNNLGVRLSSADLHGESGSSLRTRISELNADPSCPVTVRNDTSFDGETERSTYTAELRRIPPCNVSAGTSQLKMFGDISPFRYPD